MSLPTFEELAKRIPDVRSVVAEALEAAVALLGNEPASIKAKFSTYVDDIEAGAYAIYLRYEREAWDSVASREPQRMQGAFDPLFSLFQSIAQSRRARAGSSFEEALRALFLRSGYPFEEQPILDGKPDFVFPNAVAYRADPRNAIVFTAKRTLRERWRQVATEGVRGVGQFLATIDRAVPETALASMLSNRIYLVVPKNNKESIAAYRKSPTVLSFEDFLEDHLDPAMVRWKKAGLTLER